MLSILACLVISLSVEISSTAFVPADKEELAKAVRWMSWRHFVASDIYGDISQWNVSKVTDMSNLFSADSGVFSTYEMDSDDLSKWDVSKVTDMSGMFRQSKFSGDLSKWDVSRVTDMSGMFERSSFNGDLSKWDVSKVTDMSRMFLYSSNFNGDLTKWDVSKVTDMNRMFQDTTFVNGDLSKWDVSKVSDMSNMFEHSRFNGDLSKWNISERTSMLMMFWKAACSLCDHVPHRLETQCKRYCGPRPSAQVNVNGVQMKEDGGQLKEDNSTWSMVKALSSLFGFTNGGTLKLAYQDCGAAHGKVTGLSPSTLTLGQKTTVTGSGSVDEAVTDGTFEMNIKASILSKTCTGNICQPSTCPLPAGVGSITWNGMKCPLAKGDVTVGTDVILSGALPPWAARATIGIKGKASNGDDLLCMTLSTAPAEASAIVV